MSVLPQVCAWCWQAGQLVILNDATWEQALAAMDDGSLSHGVCERHADEIRKRSMEVTR